MARETKKEGRTGSREEAVYLFVQKTAEGLKANFYDLFKSHDLTLNQYNVLRILREANTRGASCTEIAERLVTKDSDMTRMLERMEVRQLIRRQRQDQDRRVVLAFIAEKGLTVLESLDKPVDNLHRQQFSALSKKDLDKLLKLLRKATK